jgi:hypothetical protein
MKLLTKEIRNTMPKIGTYAEGGAEDAPIVVKYFTPWSNWTWYAYEGGPVLDEGQEVDYEFFGLVEGLETELGYFVLSELESVQGPWGLKIERDLHFSGKTLKDIMK